MLYTYALSECDSNKFQSLDRSLTQDLAIVDVAFRAYDMRRAVRLWVRLIGEHGKR